MHSRTMAFSKTMMSSTSQAHITMKANPTSNGRLFKRVLRDLKIHPSKLTHHGDDAWSDISQARQLSIKTRRINHCDLTKRENEILNSTSIISSLLSSRLIGHMRAQRVATPHSLGMNIYDDFTKNFSGPFLWLFAEWILGKAVKNEAQEIYFCSRDCLGLMIITERLAKLRKGSLKLRYVATSRQALVLATLRRGKESLHLKDLTEALNGLKLKEILQKIDIDQQFFLEFMRKNKLPLTDLNTILDSENKWEIFWQSLEDSSIRSHLNEIAANEQRSALQYFKEAGLLSSTKKIIVDFGWRQNCQSMIMDLIKSNKSQNQVTFLYLGLADRRNLRAASARAEALFYGSESRNSAPSNNGISKIIDKTQLIEVLMSCDPSDSIQSYQLDSPKCQYKLAGELKLRKEMNLSIERFARSIGRSFPLGEHDLRLTAIKLMDYWLESPKSQWHSLFKDVTTIKEAFRGSDTIIAEPLHFHLNHLKSSRILPLIAGRRASGSRAWEKLALSKTSLIGYFLFLPASIMTRTVFLYSRRLRISKPEHRVINTAINLLLMLSIKLKRAISNAAKSIRFIIEKSYD